MRKAELVMGATAAVVAFGSNKMALQSRIPSIGPVSAPITLIVVGLAILAFAKIDGTVGDVVDGVGVGLAAYGASQL